MGSCLDRARNSSKACLNGIAKADLVLKECRGDTDILCIALVRRAELLLIAVSLKQQEFLFPFHRGMTVPPTIVSPSLLAVP